MLDYFLLQGFVEMNEDGSIAKTEACPDDLRVMPDKDGTIKFYWKLYQNDDGVLLKNLKQIEDYESLNQ